MLFSMSNNSTVVQDRATVNCRLIGSRYLSTGVTFDDLNDPDPEFKVTPLFDVECLRNGKR